MEEGVVEINKESKESIKDVSEKFLDLIFSSLERLEEYERNMREGCTNLLEYMRIFNIKDTQIGYIQQKNMYLMIDEIEILFGNIKAIVNKTNLAKLEEELDRIQKIVYYGKIKKDGETKYFPFREIKNQVKKSKTITPTSSFPVISTWLSDLRTKIIFSLRHILYSRGKIEEDKKKTY